MLNDVRKRTPLPPEDERRLTQALARLEKADRAVDELLTDLVERGLATSAGAVLGVSRQAVYQRVERFRKRALKGDGS